MNKDGINVHIVFLVCFNLFRHPESIYTGHDGPFNYKRLQDSFKREGITRIIALTHANVAERAIRTFKKIYVIEHYKHKRACAILSKLGLDKQNKKMVHYTTGMIPDEAFKGDSR